jgi:hypothetical protein
MKTTKLYHGSNASNLNDVIDYPKAKSAINGFGFYVTKDIEVAKQYGRVVYWEVETALIENCKERPIDQRYVENIELYDECAEGGMEIALPQYLADLMATHAIDAGLVTR